MCPLLIAVDNRNLQLTRVLVYVKCPVVDLNVSNQEGKTALILACERNMPEMVELFLSEDIVERIKICLKDVSNLPGYNEKHYIDS